MSCDAEANRLMIGRWVCGKNWTVTCPNGLQHSANPNDTTISISGYIQPIRGDGAADGLYQYSGPSDSGYQALLKEAKRIRRELMSLVEYQRDMRRPVLIWLESDLFERCMAIPLAVDITVEKFALNNRGPDGAFLSNGIKYKIDFERVGGESEIEFESRIISSMRPTYWTFPIGAPSFRSGLWAPPAEADLTAYTNNAGFARGVALCDGSATNMRVFREIPQTASLPMGRVDARRWKVDFESDPLALQKGAVTIWTEGVNNVWDPTKPLGRVAVGRWVPDHGKVIPPDWWELENGIIRLRQWTDGVVAGFAIQSFYGGVWSPFRSFHLFENGNGTPIIVWKDMQILRNDEEDCAIRFVGSTTNDYMTDRRTVLDISLRRGARHLEMVASYPDSSNNGFALRGIAGASNHTIFSQIGVRGNNPIGGWRFPVMTPQSLTDWDLNNGIYNRNTNRIRWAIGATPPGFTSGGIEGWENIEADYLAATNESVHTVR